MSSQNDNPLIRFVAFWWALGVFSLFAVILLAVKLLGGGKAESNPLEEAAAAKRYDAAAKVKAAQAANLAYKEVEAGKVVQVPPHDVFEIVGKGLVASKGAAVKDPAQIIPGGIAVPKDDGNTDFGAVDKLTPPADTALDPAVMEDGKATYMTCFGCHGANGEGMAVLQSPPLAGSEWVAGPVSNLIRIQFRGLVGPINVAGKQYNVAGGMLPVVAALDDAKIANVLTYVRNSFGNKAAPVLPEQVKMLRSELGKPQLTEADLIKPTKP